MMRIPTIFWFDIPVDNLMPVDFGMVAVMKGQNELEKNGHDSWLWNSHSGNHSP
jgi:hypothetical protein